jgi:2-C-methyl-D-erythritol 4-phosphate cytidylyltransferase
LKKAYQQQYDPSFTDDATVVEASGEKIILIEGSTDNIKITRPHGPDHCRSFAESKKLTP